MSLTAHDMRELDDDARQCATESCRGYLADAVRSLRDTGDPVATLALLHAMWSSHARRRNQKAALDDAGIWLERRLVHTPGISVDRLALELGWLQRLITIHIARDKQQRDRNADGSARDAANHERDMPRRPAFGNEIERLRSKRARALQAASSSALETSLAIPPAPAPPPRLPDLLEVRFSEAREAIEAFKSARERRNKGKSPKPRILPVRPVRDELVSAVRDLACSLLDTEGMPELEARYRTDSGRMPSFWIVTADLPPETAPRLVRRILLDPVRPTTTDPVGERSARDPTGE